MTTRSKAVRVVQAFAVLLPLMGAVPARAQATQGSGSKPPDDTPSFKVGTTIFTDYTYTDEPTTTDVDGNTIHPSGFNVTRAYINVTGNISDRVSFRVTPDVTRQSTTTTTTNLGLNESVSASTSTDGSLVYRLKYAYGQFNLDDSWGKGSWARFGVHITPYIDWLEGIYRYRFQGTVFVDREGYMSSSDFGLSTHYNFPGDHGDVHGGYYNGDTYSKPEANSQQAIQARVSYRPAPQVRGLAGLRVTAFYDADHYAQSDPKTRFIGTVTYEHKYVHAGFEYLEAKDQPRATDPTVKARGYSVWATPISGRGWEGLLRYDHLKPNTDVDAAKNRKIVGVAYWFKTRMPHAKASLLLDYETVGYDSALGKPDEKRYGLHSLFNF